MHPFGFAKSDTVNEILNIHNNFVIVVCFLLGNSPASEVYMLSSQAGKRVYTRLPTCEDGTDRVFRNVGK
jgi:hypothetical protein